MANHTRVFNLFDYAYHHPAWLEKVSAAIKPEPWGKDNMALAHYLKINFLIAQQQGKVFEDADVAMWKPGYLKNDINDPVWMVYERNHRPHPKWYFNEMTSGENPHANVWAKDYQVKYDVPPFEETWELYFDQNALNHIFENSKNLRRLNAVFGEMTSNIHLVFRTVFGEIQLQRKDVLYYPQWYRGSYNFLIPLFLTNPNKMDMVATLTPNTELRRYEISTLLLPGQVYGAVRAIARSREMLPHWLLLQDTDFQKEHDTLFSNNVGQDEEEEDM